MPYMCHFRQAIGMFTLTGTKGLLPFAQEPCCSVTWGSVLSVWASFTPRANLDVSVDPNPLSFLLHFQITLTLQGLGTQIAFSLLSTQQVVMVSPNYSVFFGIIFFFLQNQNFQLLQIPLYIQKLFSNVKKDDKILDIYCFFLFDFLIKQFCFSGEAM